jgi:hypothetical protein
VARPVEIYRRQNFKQLERKLTVGTRFVEREGYLEISGEVLTEPTIREITLDGKIRRQLEWTARIQTPGKTYAPVELHYLVTDGAEHYGPKIFMPGDDA